MLSKKVCHVSTAHNEKDPRIVLKECQSLKKAGYDVSYIVTADKEEEIHGIRIIPLSKGTGRIYRLINKQKEALKKAIQEDADIYHFHDPELISLGKKLKKMGKKVIYDVHEDMPKQIIAKSYLGPLFIRKIISKSFNIYEKSNAKRFDAIVTTIDGLKVKFEEYNNNVIVAKNYAMKDVIDESIAIERGANSDKLVILYIGSITEIRGVKELITSIVPFCGAVELWLMGTWETEELRKSCEKLEGYKHTKYLGVFKPHEVYSYVKSADIGMCVLHPTPNYKEAIPTKVFEYMACEMPVILSDFPFWKKLFGDVGIYVDPLKIEDTTSAIKFYLNNRNEIKKKGMENREKFIENFCWDSEEKKLLELYKELI